MQDLKTEEHVVLVDELNTVLGIMPKKDVHTSNTPLHRAFSAFIFNGKKELLLQQRSSAKKAWPLAWSNSCCGHPALNESNEDAVRRRALFELGITLDSCEFYAPYRYCFTKDGIMENEICPIYVATLDTNVQPNPDEVEATAWISWHDFRVEIKANSEKYSPWCKEEAFILDRMPKFQLFLN
jgi:isopentenyl-diphosphate delta-isomerase